jgi:protein-L-isoaspartate O-methyltransferase
VQHLSAPGIYGCALEALELREGHCFLNVCSGTGYFSALASQILGKKAVHRAIELRPELIEHASAKLAAIDCSHVELVLGSCLALCPDTSMRFERIYLGAGADETMGAILFRMLEMGGVLVGPFAGADGNQRLLRVRRVNEAEFDVTELMHVQFTPLLPATSSFAGMPSPMPNGPDFFIMVVRSNGFGASHTVWGTPVADESSKQLVLKLVRGPTPPTTLHMPAGTPSPLQPASPRGVRTRTRLAPISLPAPTWAPELHDRFPPAHRAAVRTLLLTHARPDSLLAKVPKDVLVDVLIPHLGYAAFQRVTSSGASSGTGDDAKASPAASPAVANDEAGSSQSEDEDEDEDVDVEAEGSEAEPRTRLSSCRPSNSSEASVSTRSRSYEEEDYDEEDPEQHLRLPLPPPSIPPVRTPSDAERRGLRRLLRCL